MVAGHPSAHKGLNKKIERDFKIDDNVKPFTLDLKPRSLL